MAKMSEQERLRQEHLLGLRGKKFIEQLDIARAILAAAKAELGEDRHPLKSMQLLEVLIECVDALEMRIEAIEREVLPGESFIRGDDVPHKLS